MSFLRNKKNNRQLLYGQKFRVWELPAIILGLFSIPFVALASFGSVLGNIVQTIICIVFHAACPDACLSLEGPASYALCHLVDRIANALYIIGWGLALVVILIGGISYMVSGGEEEKTKKAKKIITSGLIGAAIILTSGFILSLLVEFLAPLFYY